MHDYLIAAATLVVATLIIASITFAGIAVLIVVISYIDDKRDRK